MKRSGLTLKAEKKRAWIFVKFQGETVRVQIVSKNEQTKRIYNITNEIDLWSSTLCTKEVCRLFCIFVTRISKDVKLRVLQIISHASICVSENFMPRKVILISMVRLD